MDKAQFVSKRLPFFISFLLLSQILFFTSLDAVADDTSSNATELFEGTAETSWICSPDCGSEPVDSIDWYKTTLQEKQQIQFFIHNNNDYSLVTLEASLFSGSDSNLQETIQIEADENNSLTIYVEEITQLFVSVEAIDGWGDDGTNYTISMLIESDNHADTATRIEVGKFLEIGYVCISDCPGGILDSEDWYVFSVNAGDQIGVVAEELTWFTYLDFEIYIMNEQNNPELHTYEYHGGSAGGPQDYSVRAWFNATETQEIYVRVFTNQSDDVLYNLSVSSGQWVNVIEDDFYWLSFPNLQFGDTLRVQAIRTDTPNDLDILLFNSSEFQSYRNEVVNNDSSSPSELMAVPDCLVCSFSFTLTNEVSGLTSAKPSKFHDSNQKISWAPSLYFVADYTDYRSNPPANSEIDVASVFLSVSLLESAPVVENYDIFVYNDLGNLTLYSSGVVSNGEISPPDGSWPIGLTSNTEEKSTSTFLLRVTAASTGEVHSNSQFEIYNYRPEVCLTVTGDLNGAYVEGLPIHFNSACSFDLDNDLLTQSWKINGVEVDTSEQISVSPILGQLEVELVVSDIEGLNDSFQTSIDVVPFPKTHYSESNDIEYVVNSDYTITSRNVIYDNTTISPEWTNWEIIGSQIGIGLSIESRVVQSSETSLSFIHDESSEQTQITLLESRSITETALKVNLILIIRDVENGSETVYDMPMPTADRMYDGQSWIVVPSLTGFLTTVYFWDRLAVVDSGVWVDGMSDYSELDLEMPTLDLIQYIELLIQTIPGSQLPLLFLGLAVDYNLFIDIDLKLEIHNEGGIQIYHQPNGQSPGQYFYPTATISQQTNQSYSLYPFTSLDSTIDIFGSIGLRLRIAQPGWLTFGLGYLVDDPMFLEGNWETELTNSDDALASSHSLGFMLSDASVQGRKIFVPPVQEGPIDDQNTGAVDDSQNSNGDDNTNDGGNTGINESPSIDDLNSELLNSKTLIFIGISSLTILLVAIRLVMKLKKKRPADRFK
uniref:Uncharacterized protein n=1 Tax=uncultured marine group II/III euryarchaeote KM3_99_A09 TaxID=1456549 RepID=A0A075I0G6_9EURY|nr:hypothetical protein [uncultured marine group II/III euryarchaeote KM3_99_A09]